ncbi:MAG: GxxExxY protein, partial [Dolichospermum sp.]
VYNEMNVGELTFDMIVDDKVIVSVTTNYGFIDRLQEEQAKVYLLHSKHEVLLLLNFGLESHYKRLFLENQYKRIQYN